MAGPLILLGTGTSVGKTHVGERLLRALDSMGRKAYGYKPLESGVCAEFPTDAERLARATTFHVKHPPLRVVFPQPLSPHLAARMAGTDLDLPGIHRAICALAIEVETLLVELPGGAFSPLSESVLVAGFALSIPAARFLLVAPDRIGVLHDIGATSRAAAAIGLPITGVVLSAPEASDDSTGRNADEIGLVSTVPYLATFPRETRDAPTPPGHAAHRVIHALKL